MPVPPGTFLEGQPQPELDLARVAGAALHRAVEVEHQVRDLGGANVLLVEEIEDLEDRLDRDLPEVEGARDAEVEGGELIVLPARVPLDHARARVDDAGDRGRTGNAPVLGRIRGHSRRVDRN